jgi:hypothetical protein
MAKAQDTSSMIANMMGLGPLMAQMQDPAFLAQVKAIVDAIAETRARVERIENLLSFPIARLPDGDETRTAAAAFAQLGADGTGTRAVASGAADDGTSGTSPEAGGSGNRRAATSGHWVRGEWRPQ